VLRKLELHPKLATDPPQRTLYVVQGLAAI